MLFVFKARRRAHSRAYVTEVATPKTGNRASKIGKLFLDDSLMPSPTVFPLVVVVDMAAVLTTAIATAVTLFGALDGSDGAADYGARRSPVAAADNPANDGATGRAPDRLSCNLTGFSVTGYDGQLSKHEAGRQGDG